MEDIIIAVIEVENFEECNRFLKLEDCVLIQTYTKHVIKSGRMSQQIVYVLGIKSLETMAVINELQEKRLLIEFNNEKGFELTVEGLNMSEELKKEVSEQINYLEIQKSIIECKDFLDNDDNELLARINDEIKLLKEKLKKC